MTHGSDVLVRTTVELLTVLPTYLGLQPYSFRLDYLVFNGNSVLEQQSLSHIHPLSDPFKVFLLYLKYSRVTTSHQQLYKSPLDLSLT